MMLELKDGSLITPLGVFDVLDTVEEYLGTDVRQYLEAYFSDEDPWTSLPDGEKTALLLEHYQTVLEGIDDVISEADRLMRQNPVKRKKVVEDLDVIRKMIEKERVCFGKEDI